MFTAPGVVVVIDVHDVPDAEAVPRPPLHTRVVDVPVLPPAPAAAVAGAAGTIGAAAVRGGFVAVVGTRFPATALQTQCVDVVVDVMIHGYSGGRVWAAAVGIPGVDLYSTYLVLKVTLLMKEAEGSSVCSLCVTKKNTPCT